MDDTSGSGAVPAGGPMILRDAMADERIRPRLLAYLNLGVTAVADLFRAPGDAGRWRAEQRAGTLLGLRLFTSGPGFTNPPCTTNWRC